MLRRRTRRFDPIVLFALTIASTTYVGGWVFSATLLAILVAHEMGHYLVARRHGVPASLPYFLPFPFSMIGTFGAVIAVETDRANRNELLDIGAAGPICGFILAVPAMIAGILLSGPTPPNTAVTMIGDSLLTRALLAIFAPGQDLFMHPVMLAAWAGLLVTTINLIPVSQLDGGHILHALTPRGSERWMKRIHKILLGLGIAGLVVHGPTILWSLFEGALIPIELLELTRPLFPYFSPGFLILAFLAHLMGVKHPPLKDDEEPLTRGRRAIGILCLAIWILTFMPNPAWQDAPWLQQGS